MFIKEPQFQKILLSEESSFSCKRLDLPYFDGDYHYHPEYELKFIIRSRGKRFLGDNVESFQEGDLVLVGPNIPHYWKNDLEYYYPNSLCSSAIIILFSEAFLGDSFFSLPELLPIKDMFL
jgi:hypothetical protein